VGLESLLLAHNAIELIDTQAFLTQRKLKVLDLTSNNLTSLHPETLEVVERSLDTLKMEGKESMKKLGQFDSLDEYPIY